MQLFAGRLSGAFVFKWGVALALVVLGGLGLPIARALLLAADGSLDLKGDGRPCVFEARLPVAG